MKPKINIKTILLAVILFCCFWFAGSYMQSQEHSSLVLVAEYPVAVPEPSGLALSADGSCLWTVSDHSKRAYRLSLQGKILDTLPATNRDLEGIAFTDDEGYVWLVDEVNREILQMDTLSGEIDNVYALAISGAANSGLEGIAWHAKKRVCFVLNEKNPGRIYRLTSGFEIAQTYVLDAAKDYSGLAYDKLLNKFWIISDQSRLLMRWSEDNGVEAVFPLPVKKAEGIAINVRERRFYIVSDKDALLYVFDMIDESQ